MDFFEIKLNDCFSTLYRINEILQINPNIQSKLEMGKDIETLIKSYQPYNKDNAEVKSYNIIFKNGSIITISNMDYEILKEKIKKLQGGIL